MTAGVLLVLALPAGGCDTGVEAGGDGTARPKSQSAKRPAGTADEKAIRAVLVRLFKTQDVRAICERSLTSRLFRVVHPQPRRLPGGRGAG